jgi:hypothetical protein
VIRSEGGLEFVLECEHTEGENEKQKEKVVGLSDNGRE